MGRPQNLNGGCRPTFPRHVSNGLADVGALLAEATEAMDAARTRMAMLLADVDGHELVVAGARMTTCRCYHQGEVSRGELRRLPPAA
jgi:hypothetical protein